MSVTLIESSGAMSLETDGTNYFLQPNDGPAVKLSYGGAAVFAGEFAAYGYGAPIAAAQTAEGYEVAWRTTSGEQYQIWNIDSSGNEVSIPFVGSGAQVPAYEASFNNDLNRDGTIGAPESPPPPPPSLTLIESSGAMSLETDGTNYFLQPNDGPAVKLSYGGAAVFAGEFAAYGYGAPIAAAQTAEGYEVAWRTTSGEQYQVWNIDSSGNEVSIPFIGSGAQVPAYEASFNNDLNRDGTIGAPESPPPPPPSLTLIESSGAMSLETDGTNYFLQPNDGPAVKLSYGGAAVFAGEFAAYGYGAPIAAAQTAEGYEVAWRTTSGEQYQVWNIDSSGNEVSIPFVGSGAQVPAYEASFNNDLNRDGTIGAPESPPPPPPSLTLIESSGAMSLETDGTNYFLQPNDGPAVKLSYGGAAVFAGEFAAYGYGAPIAAAQTAEGYEVAWRTTSGEQYQVWNIDSSGNEVSIPFIGSGAQVPAYEASFNNDLNRDGTIGAPESPPPPPPSLTLIESSGAMSLETDGTNYFLQPNDGPAVKLSYGGAAVFAGEFAAYGYGAPIAAAQTAEGYEVAWRTTSGEQYQIWNIDSSGNEVSIPFVGSGAQVPAYEASFNNDLNRDGTIGGASPPDGGGTTGTPPSSLPQFVYAGTDASGAQIYDITWASSGMQPFAVRVLTPQHPSADYSHSFLYALQVEPGLAQSTYGSGLDELAKLNAEDEYNATIVEPIFPNFSWYADSSADATVNYETFMADILPQWVESNFGTTGTEQNLLVGFSKSGYGALDLELKHPSVFDAVAAFDFPGDMSSYNQYQGGSSYGSEANFENNYQMTESFIDAHAAPFRTSDRILISEGPAFTSQVTDFGDLLTSAGMIHTLLDQTSDAHTWSSGWLPGAVGGLYGLEQNLHPVAGA